MRSPAARNAAQDAAPKAAAKAAAKVRPDASLRAVAPLVLALGIALMPPLAMAQQAPAAAQGAQEASGQAVDPLLAGLRAELALIARVVADLRLDLVQGGQIAGPDGGDLLARLGAAEAALTRLTGQAEAIELRLRRVIEDASNRLGDLEFRLAELEGADPATLARPRPLGAPQGDAADQGGAGAPGAATQPSSFDQARALMQAGDPRGALDLLETEAAALPSDPDRIERAYLRGEALAGLGFVEASAQAFLDAFSGAPAGPFAPSALLRLGEMLGQMGAVVDACITLAEVGTRYPGLEHAQTLQAATEARAALACP